MALIVDLTTDYLYVDGLETVTFTGFRAGGAKLTATLNYAKRFELDRTLAKSLGVVEVSGDELAWLISGNELLANGGITEVQVSDVITDAAGIDWSGISKKYQAMTNMWWLVTRLEPDGG